MRKKFEVTLVRTTYDYVTVTVEEDDVTSADEATDFVNEKLCTDWDPQDDGDEGESKFGEWEVNDAGPADAEEARCSSAR